MGKRTRLRMATATAVTPPPVSLVAHDLALARQRLAGLVGAPGLVDVLAFVHAGVPIPKARARFGNGHAFTPARTARAEGELVRAFRDAWKQQPPLTDTLALVLLFYVSTRQRKDLDNLSKLVMDAGTKARIWQDDSQVKAKAVVMELDPDHPRTVIALAPRLGTMTKAPLLLETERTP